MEERNDFYVYVHTRATDGSVFYVGKGKGKRAWFKGGRSKHWKHIVAKHGYNVVVVQDNLTEGQSYVLEIILINDIGLENLCNMTYGGEGGSVRGRIVSSETKRKLSEFNKGKKRSDESKQKQSSSMKGKIKTKEHKQKLSEVHKGKIKSEDHRRKISITLRARNKALKNALLPGATDN